MRNIDNIKIRGVKNTISPIQVKKTVKLNTFARQLSTVDLETIQYKGKQLPILISHCHKDNSGNLINILFEINPIYIKNSDYIKGSQRMFNNYFRYLIKNKIHNIFAHNLGGFDGYFIIKALSQYLGDSAIHIHTLIDKQHKFITIKYKTKRVSIEFRDSYRLTGLSLDNLCKTFLQDNLRKGVYNLDWQSLKIFKSSDYIQFKSYALQDSQLLYQCLDVIRSNYAKLFNIDIGIHYSSSQLSFNIFRKLFLEHKIELLNSVDDRYIRDSYFGGHTDYFKHKVVEGYYYDVNSLYPAAMKQLMPIKILKKVHGGGDINTIFGFIKVKVNSTNVIKPMLPYRNSDGKVIYPRGEWIGTYFSEELKAMIPLGYKFEVISYIECLGEHIFNKYVDHFYSEKKHAVGGYRWIVKMHLNQLYGYFGRSLDIFKSIIIPNENVSTYISNVINSLEICREVELTEDLTLLVVQDKFEGAGNSVKKVLANVMVASAVTSYARLIMLPYLLNDNVVYTDTDSIIINEPLPDNLVGKELGQMKDELEGGIILEGYVFGIKQYVLRIKNKDGSIFDKSVWAGIKRNSLTLEEAIGLSTLNTRIVKHIDSVFIHDNKDLSISIKDLQRTIEFKPNKILKNNIYLPQFLGNL